MKPHRRWIAGIIALGCIFVGSASAWAQSTNSSLADRRLSLPTWEQASRVFLLQDHNTRVVIFGTAALGCAAGLVGSFTLLRRRALMGDALSHASLPGIALAFLLVTSAGGDGKALPVLLAGATISGLLGVLGILAIRNLTRLKEDAALGIVLSVFFGAGIVLLRIVQQMDTGHAAGLESFIYGKTASMRSVDAQLIAAVSVAVIAGCSLLFKELKLLCFDEAFAASRGKPVVLLDVALMSMVVMVSIVGLQAVGLILMIALLVIPAAAARFWTQRMSRMTLISAVLGAMGGILGAAISALFSKLPSGAMIVLVCTGFFLLSMVFGPARGVLTRTLRRRRLNHRVERQHLLRAIYECLETEDTADPAAFQQPVETATLLPMRSWSIRRLRTIIRRAEEEALLRWRSEQEQVSLTTSGVREAARLTREHRLWELYLISYAEVAPSRVDRDADAIEHVLEPEIIDELESLLDQRSPSASVPASPHELETTLGTQAALSTPTESSITGTNEPSLDDPTSGSTDRGVDR